MIPTMKIDPDTKTVILSLPPGWRIDFTDRKRAGVLMGAIQKWIEREKPFETTAFAVWRGAAADRDNNKATQMEIAACLKRLGYRNAGRRNGISLYRFDQPTT